MNSLATGHFLLPTAFQVNSPPNPIVVEAPTAAVEVVGVWADPILVGAHTATPRVRIGNSVHAMNGRKADKRITIENVGMIGKWLEVACRSDRKPPTATYHLLLVACE